MIILQLDEARLREILRVEIAALVKPAQDDAILDRNALAAMLGVHARDLRRLELEGEIPPPLRIGRRVRWRRETISKWIANLERNSLDAGAKKRLHVQR